MSESTYQSILASAMDNLRQMIDINTIVGAPVHVPDGTVVLPICRASFALVAGGGEYQPKDKPTAGATAAGVTINPVAFLVAGKDTVRVIPTDASGPYDRIIDAIPQVISEIRGIFAQGAHGDEMPGE